MSTRIPPEAILQKQLRRVPNKIAAFEPDAVWASPLERALRLLAAQAGTLVFVSYLALISISLGVLNLLPVPLLDGGHLLYYLAEIVKGSPVSDRAFEVGQRIGMAMLAVLMALALFNDVSRLF